MQFEFQNIQQKNRVFYLFVTTNAHTNTYIEMLNYITDAPTCFGASASSSRSFDTAFAKLIKY
jgi:SUMO ligase MMS21 Smc5/6 complex component